MAKILFVIGSLGLGGAESQMVALAQGLASRGWQCKLFVLEPGGSLGNSLHNIGVTVHDAGYASSDDLGLKLLKLLRALGRLIVLAARFRPDVLHAYLPLTNFLGAAVGRLTGVPRVITSRRALGTHQDRHPLWKRFDRLANRLSHLVIANSEAVAEDTVQRDRLARHKLKVIHNGLDAQRFEVAARHRNGLRRALGLDANTFGIVTVANLIPYKGHVELLRAIPRIQNTTKDLKFYLVGEDRGMRQTLQALAEDLKVASKVSFLGQRMDIPDLLAAMDLFVLPSHEEGFSNALLEAMAAGLPVVATDVGGNREALEMGRVGVLVPPRDFVALAASIERLIADDDLCLKLGRAASQCARAKYSMPAMVDAHINCYRMSNAF